MTQYIKTVDKSPSDFIKIIRYNFGLNEYPFDYMDDNLIMLAFTPACKNSLIPKNTKFIIKEKYGICDHQSLEFYGDKVLYLVISSILNTIFGLAIVPKIQTEIMSYLTSNRMLTDIMLDSDGCSYVRFRDYKIYYDKKPFHNICADSFEALVGALFYHLENERLDVLENIRKWILKHTIFPHIIKEYLIDNNYDNDVYVINKRDIIRTNWNLHYNDSLSINSFPYVGLIITHNEYLVDIFRSLGWKYEFKKSRNLYSLVVPAITGDIVFKGDNVEKIINNVKNFLYETGYVVELQHIKKNYS